MWYALNFYLLLPVTHDASASCLYPVQGFVPWQDLTSSRDRICLDVKSREINNQLKKLSNLQAYQSLPVTGRQWKPNRCLCTAALPTLDIAEGALDRIFSLYKELLPSMGGYLTHAGELDRGRLQVCSSHPHIRHRVRATGCNFQGAS